VAARLAACAQVSGPLTSTYWWDGAVRTELEWQVTFKTTVDGYAALADHVRTHHSYDVPEILCTPVLDGAPAYLAWIAEQVRPAGSTPAG